MVVGKVPMQITGMQTTGMWITDIEGLKVIDWQLSTHSLAPAEYEIARRVVYATGDLEFEELLQFSPNAVLSGVGALAARTAIAVDVSSIQSSLFPKTQGTFFNQIYSAQELWLRSSPKVDPIAQRMKLLTQRCAGGIFVVGQSLPALEEVLTQIEADEVRPALIVATPTQWVNQPNLAKRLQDCSAPAIWVNSSKGGMTVAIAILNGLIDLAWQVYSMD